MYAILGQGIAGTILALRFLERGEKFKIFDDNYSNSSSMVAAGLWNPIVFRRINKSWRADEFINEIESFYPKWEEKLGVHFYFPKPVWRIHGSKQERDKWDEKKMLPGFQGYLKDITPHLEKFSGFEASHGEGEIGHTGYLDLPVFLKETRNYFRELNVYKQTALPETPDSNYFAENGDRIDGIIDCRGNSAALTSWWSYLPFGLTKGEVLTLSCPGLKLDKTFNAGFFVLPLGGDLFRVGATFNWDQKDSLPTESGKEELLTKFKKFVNLPFEVVDHRAGLRPTVQDRRPLIGKHPEISNLFSFNGLGTKGVLLAPSLSVHFLKSLFEGLPLPADLDISRFDHLFGTRNPQVNFPVA